jgi:hypothetical protein
MSEMAIYRQIRPGSVYVLALRNVPPQAKIAVFMMKAQDGGVERGR